MLGGDGNYTYFWSNGAVTKDIINVPAGAYSVTVTDGNGCVGTLGVSISQPDQMIQTQVNSLRVSCSGVDDGNSVISTTGGISPYDYTWDRVLGGYTYTDSNVVSSIVTDLPFGEYNLYVNDSNNCRDTVVFIINNVNPITISTDTAFTDIVADTNRSMVGSIEPGIYGGTEPYISFIWLPDGETTQNIYNKEAGNYTLSVVDANGCNTSTVFIIPNYSITPTLDTIDYNIDTVSSQWAIKINAGIKDANNRIPTSMDTITIGVDGPEDWFFKSNIFIKKFSSIQNDTAVYLRDTWAIFKIKINAAIREEDNTN